MTEYQHQQVAIGFTLSAPPVEHRKVWAWQLDAALLDGWRIEKDHWLRPTMARSMVETFYRRAEEVRSALNDGWS